MDGRRALITGAAGGIGRATSLALARSGAVPILWDRDREGIERTAAQVAQLGVTPVVDVVDVACERSVAEAAERLAEHTDALDVVVGCAGVSGPVGTPLEHTTRADWDRVFAVNVTGSFQLLRAGVPLLRRSDEASVVLVASDSALVATAGMAPYAASKAAVLQLVKAASVELAPDRIRVNAVCPSIVDTPMSRGDLQRTAGFDDAPYPVQRAEEVAEQILWLCSPAARPVNGHGLVSDFGFSARSMFPA